MDSNERDAVMLAMGLLRGAIIHQPREEMVNDAMKAWGVVKAAIDTHLTGHDPPDNVEE